MIYNPLLTLKYLISLYIIFEKLILSNISDIYFLNFGTSLATDMSFMFYNCISLKSLDISNFNRPSIIDMSFLFYECISVKYLNAKNY